jgi:hypothetical protein
MSYDVPDVDREIFVEKIKIIIWNAGIVGLIFVFFALQF